jgi:hypothetical protein
VTTDVSRSPSQNVRFARRSTRGLLLGFSTPRVVVLGGAGVIATLALFAGGPAAFVLAALVWLPLAASAMVRVGGRPAVEWAATAIEYQGRRLAGQAEYRARTSRPRPAGTLALPGSAATLRLHVDEPSGAAMIHDPHRHTLTAVIAVTHPAFALLDDSDRAGRVGRWGRVIAGLAASGTCAAVQVLEATVLDPGSGQREWWQEHRSPGGSWATDQYQALLDQIALDSSTHRTTVSLSLDLRAAARAVRSAGRGVRGAAEVLRADMASFSDALRLAGLRAGAWLGERELAVILRDAFDPAVSTASPNPAARLAHAGPVAVSESWDRLRHDSGWSQVLWITEWPRIPVPPDFLHPLLFAPGVRRTVCLLARPLPTYAALRQIRREKTEAVADSAQKAKIGQLADLSDGQEYEDLLARERSIIAGHTDVTFSGYVTVTAPSQEALDATVATITRAAGQSCCEVQPIYGHQMEAFVTAALPLARTTF